ncbi:MAG: PQQ-binding-like beta-propeller repeat protein, partial [Anaerolinea sp.]|nr:PQQ-binding-like beta-propeller repeat protein [Anaerolinea sp.]
ARSLDLALAMPSESVDEPIPDEPTPAPTLVVNQQGQIPPWEIRPSSNTPLHFYSPVLTLDANTLLAAAYEKTLFEVRAQTGTVLSSTTLPGHVVGPALLTEDLLYVPMSEGDVIALRRQPNGSWTEVWRFDTEHGVYAQPLLVDDTLYIASLDHILYAVDPATGSERWRLRLNGAIASAPVLHDGMLYLGTLGRRIYAVSQQGEIVAEYVARDWVWGAPTIVDGVLYAADLGGYVYALSVEGNTFSPMWEPRQVASRGIRATPLVTDSRIIVGSRDRNVYWLNRMDGQEILRREVRGEVLADLLLLEPNERLRIGEPLVLVSTMAPDQLLTAFTLNEGISRWSYGR